MKRMILLLSLIGGLYAAAQFSPPSAVTNYTGTINVYGTDSAGDGIATNTFVYSEGLLRSFP